MSRALTVADAFALARDLADSGRADDASIVCSKILEADSTHATTLHLLGILSFRRGDPRAAVALLERATAAAPDFAQAFNDLGNVLMHQGRTADAITHYRRAIALAPAYPEA